ncbi:MAG: type II toxin-antitoxin system YafQ family toxin [Nitrospiria bacterium]
MATDIVIPEPILKRLNRLPKEVRIKFWEQLEKLTQNPSYPGLRNEKLKGIDRWAFSITMNYRATYIRDKTSIIITAIGTHQDVLGN